MLMNSSSKLSLIFSVVPLFILWSLFFIFMLSSLSKLLMTSIVKGVPTMGALYSFAMKGMAPQWSRWQWLTSIPLTLFL